MMLGLGCGGLGSDNKPTSTAFAGKVIETIIEKRKDMLLDGVMIVPGMFGKIRKSVHLGEGTSPGGECRAERGECECVRQRGFGRKGRAGHGGKRRKRTLPIV